MVSSLSVIQKKRQKECYAILWKMRIEKQLKDLEVLSKPQGQPLQKEKECGQNRLLKILSNIMMVLKQGSSEQPSKWRTVLSNIKKSALTSYLQGFFTMKKT